MPSRFFNGGFIRLSLLLHELYHRNLSYFIVAANFPMVVASCFTVNRRFAVRTLLCVLLLCICLLGLPYLVITSDKLLISFFGRFYIGVGVGLIMLASCVLDGIEALPLYTLKRTRFTITEIILGINIFIFVIAAFKFGLEASLYSILTYFTATKTTD